MGYWFTSTGEDMNRKHFELTPERLMEMGQSWWPIYLSRLSVEERLAGLSPTERLRGLKLAERLSGLKPEERLSGLKPKDRLKGLSLEEIEELKTYLQQLDNSASTHHSSH
jgi:hypothetical protein